MGFVKVIKNKAYFSRYQTKFRRRREAKTDYYARKRLIQQDKNKYKAPKYRFVVRFTNRDVICQIVAADMDHDVVLASAYSHELQRYGLTVGLKNYPAAYCTGLLLARRVNAKFNLDYDGPEEVDGEYFLVEQEGDGSAPFRALLDVGLRQTSTGCRLFGALKGAVDGGLNIPHSTRRFPGSKDNEKGDDDKWSEDADFHKGQILGAPIANYMSQLKALDDGGDAYSKQFGNYQKQGVEGDDLEALYIKVHAAIRANANLARPATTKGYFLTRAQPKAADDKYPKKQWKTLKISRAQRNNRVRQILSKRGLVSRPVLINDTL